MMDPEGNLAPNIFLLLFLVLCCAFFTASETAIVALSDNKVKKMAREGDKRARLIEKLVEKPTRFLSVVQTGVALSGCLAAVAAARSFSAPLARRLAWLPFNHDSLDVLCAIIIAFAVAYILLVFGLAVPRRAAMTGYEKLSFALAPPLYFFSVISAPFVLLVSGLSYCILRIFGIAPGTEPDEVTEEEIRMLVEVGGERGSIEESEKEMINNIFEFDDRTVDEMMSHRTEIVAVEAGTPLEEIIALALDSGYSRIPVYENDMDNILGLLYVKDLLALIPNSADGTVFLLDNYLREPLYVLETNSCMDVLSEFKARKMQMAIVVDEYGGTSGLVTMEDLLESIVGSIQDEYDEEEDEEIASLGDGTYLVDGLTLLSDIDKHFGLTLSDEDDFDTIGGYVIDRLGRIPTDGEHPSVDVGGLRFIVSEMDERRVAKLTVEHHSKDETGATHNSQ